MRITTKITYPKTSPDILILEDSDSVFSCIKNIFTQSLNGKEVEEVIGLDQIYIDYRIDGCLVTLHSDAMAGISIDCKEPKLRERIYSVLEKTNC